MKKSKLYSDQCMDDKNIDRYCQSVAELLKTIYEKSGMRSYQKIPEESYIIDYTEELLRY